MARGKITVDRERWQEDEDRRASGWGREKCEGWGAGFTKPHFFFFFFTTYVLQRQGGVLILDYLLDNGQKLSLSIKYGEVKLFF